MLDRKQLITVGTGNGPAASLKADAQVLAPSMPGYRPTIPGASSVARPDTKAAHPAAAPGRLHEVRRRAGARRASRCAWSSRAPQERDAAQRIANEVARQLTAGGIDTEVVTPPANQVYAQLYTGEGAQGTDGQDNGEPFDLAVMAQPVGGDDATTLATNFGCAPGPGRRAAGGREPVRLLRRGPAGHDGRGPDGCTLRDRRPRGGRAGAVAGRGLAYRCSRRRTRWPSARRCPACPSAHRFAGPFAECGDLAAVGTVSRPGAPRHPVRDHAERPLRCGVDSQRKYLYWTSVRSWAPPPKVCSHLPFSTVR